MIIRGDTESFLIWQQNFWCHLWSSFYQGTGTVTFVVKLKKTSISNFISIWYLLVQFLNSDMWPVTGQWIIQFCVFTRVSDILIEKYFTGTRLNVFCLFPFIHFGSFTAFAPHFYFLYETSLTALFAIDVSLC